MNILSLCIYPVATPRHGGQLRVHYINKYYQKRGHTVQIVGLGSNTDDGYIPYPSRDVFNKYFANTDWMDDYAIYKLFENDDTYTEKLLKKINIIPDIIEIEHPWLLSFVSKISHNFPQKPLLVYSSHNYEAKLKMDIASSFFGIQRGKEIFALIWDIEKRAIEQAAAILCCSQQNIDFYHQYAKAPLFLVPNGVADRTQEEADIATVQKITNEQRFALFCASGHPPNVKGFLDMFGRGIACLSPEEKIVITGSCAHLLQQSEAFARTPKGYDRTLLVGEIEQILLNGFLHQAHCIILPITQGDGTNLKTAEAIWSGKYVIATNKAMRGYEQFLSEKGIFVTDDAGEFQRTLRRVMTMPPLLLDRRDIEKRKAVLWDNCLENIDNMLAYINTLR